MKKNIKRIIKISLWLLLIGIVSVFGINGYVSLIGENGLRTIDNAPYSDCIIIFGASAKNGSASMTLAKRLDMGYELYKANKAPKIIVSGDHGTEDYNEVKVMRNYLLEKGVPKENIFMDHAGFETYLTVYRAKAVFKANTAILVSQKEHLVRALYVAKRLGCDYVGVPCKDYEAVEEKYQISREFLARMKAFLDCDVLKKTPSILGEEIPVSGDGTVTDDNK